uniref:Uncharacterized protein n=1 Tax=Rhizophora mucronata TaxID=61149 RepID=A0A2P2NTM0_RHIMU
MGGAQCELYISTKRLNIGLNFLCFWAVSFLCLTLVAYPT